MMCVFSSVTGFHRHGLLRLPQIGIGLFAIGMFAAIYPVGLAIVTTKWRDTGMRIAANGVWETWGLPRSPDHRLPHRPRRMAQLSSCQASSSPSASPMCSCVGVLPLGNSRGLRVGACAVARVQETAGPCFRYRFPDDSRLLDHLSIDDLRVTEDFRGTPSGTCRRHGRLGDGFAAGGNGDMATMIGSMASSSLPWRRLPS